MARLVVIIAEDAMVKRVAVEMRWEMKSYLRSASLHIDVVSSCCSCWLSDMQSKHKDPWVAEDVRSVLSKERRNRSISQSWIMMLSMDYWRLLERSRRHARSKAKLGEGAHQESTRWILMIENAARTDAYSRVLSARHEKSAGMSFEPVLWPDAHQQWDYVPCLQFIHPQLSFEYLLLVLIQRSFNLHQSENMR